MTLTILTVGTGITWVASSVALARDPPRLSANHLRDANPMIVRRGTQTKNV